jgi:hypothetical protein
MAEKPPNSLSGAAIPRLAKDPFKHFERVLVFLAYRNVFTEEEMSLHRPDGMMISQAVKRVQSEIPRRKHLTPNTTPHRIGELLTTLLNNGEFSSDSAIRAAFSDITDHQILTGDPSIKNRIPSCPFPIGEEGDFDPVAIKRRQRMEIELGVRLRDGCDDGMPLERISSRVRRSTRLKNKHQEEKVSRKKPKKKPSKDQPLGHVSRDTIEWVARSQEVIVIVDDEEPVSQERDAVSLQVDKTTIGVALGVVSTLIPSRNCIY